MAEGGDGTPCTAMQVGLKYGGWQVQEITGNDQEQDVSVHRKERR